MHLHDATFGCYNRRAGLCECPLAHDAVLDAVIEDAQRRYLTRENVHERNRV